MKARKHFFFEKKKQKTFIHVPNLLAAISIVLTSCAALQQPGSVENANAQPVCLAAYNIDHTNVPNDSTIMFYMRDRTVWKNTLPSPCFGLAMDSRGFTYSPTDPGSDTICSNLMTFRTNTYHSVCLLGTFTKVSAPAK